jgi:hypothetical protein
MCYTLRYQVQVGICLGSLEFYHVYQQQACGHPAEVCVRLFLSFVPSCSLQLYFCLREIKSTFFGLVIKVPGYRSEVPGSIPDATTFF